MGLPNNSQNELTNKAYTWKITFLFDTSIAIMAHGCLRLSSTMIGHIHMIYTYTKHKNTKGHIVFN